ncbi:periplasmic heavy metal sensor [Phenylobacterium sp.]|uniref:periplasmic heavy metal sensor n=1 Tax=Phenylobacterium sp. TaxID=1871053 RepID=UPI0035B3FA28
MSPRALTIALLASLAVNLFAVGAGVGVLVAGRLPGPARGQPVGPAALWRAGDTLPDPERQAYRDLLRRQSMEVRDEVRRSRQARREAFESLADEPVNAPAVRARLDEARRLEMQARGGVEGSLVDFAARLPPRERADLSRGLAEFAPGPRPGRFGMGRPGMGPPHGPPGGPDTP